MLNTYMECPFKFFLLYVEKLRPFYSVRFRYGEEVHKIIREYYMMLYNGKTFTYSEIPLILSKIMHDLGTTEDVEESLKNFVEFEKDRLTWHYNSKPICVEQKFTRPPFTGIVDVIFVKGNEKIVVDWKTGRIYDITKNDRLLVQSMIYLYITQANRMYFVSLASGNVEEVKYDERYLKERVFHFYNGIKERKFFRNEGEKCSECEVNLHCYARKYGVSYEEI